MRKKKVELNPAILHLEKDKILKKVIASVGEIVLKNDFDLYRSLLKAIVSQQLSIRAADTIWSRFLTLFDDNYPNAKRVLKTDIETLRACGISYQKAGYIKNIALFSIEKSLDYKKLKKLSDEDLIGYLTQIKGVGRWTVEMILMFNLKRMDIFPKDDLGIQNGIKNLYLINESNKREFLKLITMESEKWRPYRSLACMYIWRYKDFVISRSSKVQE